MKTYRSIFTGLAIAALFFAAGALDAGFFSVGQAFITCLASVAVLCWSSLLRPARRRRPARRPQPAARPAGRRVSAPAGPPQQGQRCIKAGKEEALPFSGGGRWGCGLAAAPLFE